MMTDEINHLKAEVKSELLYNILPFWSGPMIDRDQDGYYGRIDGKGQIHTDANKGCVLNARILWTFSSACRVLKSTDYLPFADRAKDYLLQHFFDQQYGGTYWQLDYKGNVKDGKKQIYALAFSLYALVEHYRVTSNSESLDKAIELFNVIEKYSFDKIKGGYFEAFTHEWNEISDLRLSEKDANEKKTMNTHLHVLEAYTNLYRVWKDETVKKQLHGLIQIFMERIVNPETYHLDLFFDENWIRKPDVISYGHDIECSWLLEEAAHVLGDNDLLANVKNTCLQIAVASGEGLRLDGGLIYEKHTDGHFDTDRHWWVQAENVVGLVNAYQISGDASFLTKALKAWVFIKDHIIDKRNGEWFWSVNDQLQPNLHEDKAGFWKCPYHNSRMCLEILERKF